MDEQGQVQVQDQECDARAAGVAARFGGAPSVRRGTGVLRSRHRARARVSEEGVKAQEPERGRPQRAARPVVRQGGRGLLTQEHEPARGGRRRPGVCQSGCLPTRDLMFLSDYIVVGT